MEEEREFLLTCLKDHKSDKSAGFDNSECGQTSPPIYLASLLESPLKILSGILHVSSCILGMVEASIYQEKKVFQILF